MHFPNDFKVLSEQVVLSENSFGGLILAYLIATAGMQNFFLHEPFLVQIFLLIPLFVLIIAHRQKQYNLCLLWGFIFFLPPTQIILKGLAAEAFSIVYALAGFYFLRAYLVRKKKVFLIWCFLSLTFAMSSHPLGIFLSLNLALALLVHGFYTSKIKLDPIVCIFLALVFSLPFHHLESFLRFSALIRLEGTYTSFALLLCLFLVPILITWALSYTSRSTGGIFLPRLFCGGAVLGVSIFLILYLLTRDQEWIYQESLNLLLIATSYALLGKLLRDYDLSSVRGFVYLVIFLGFNNAIILYVLFYEPSLYLFFLWAILIGVQTFLETPQLTRKLILIALCIVSSNFCPNLYQFQIWLGDAGLKFFVSGLGSLHSNPLSWQPSDANGIRQELFALEERRVELVPDSLSIYLNMHLYSRLVFQNPPDFSLFLRRTKRLDDLPHEDLKALAKNYLEQGEDLFASWISSGKISYLVYALDPWEISLWPPDPLEEVLSSEVRAGEIGLHLGKAFYEYLRKDQKLKTHFDLYPIPRKNPRILLCIHKSIPPTGGSKSNLGLELSAVGYHFPIDFTKATRPAWFANLDSGIQKAILFREAALHLEKGLKYAQMADFGQALSSFRLANQLDKNNPEIERNLRDLENKFPEVVLKFLSYHQVRTSTL